MRLARSPLIAAVLVIASTASCQMPGGTPVASPLSPEPGLLFYLSAEHGAHADYAANGLNDPNYLKDVKVLPGGAKGNYLQCGDNQLLSYWAPGNIYAQRGTLAFDWRSRTPVDETAFPVFRVGYGDHSSWDMVWLRIDWNGHGFDAFVTDVNLGRTRVHVVLPGLPTGDRWFHLALAWDETTGIRFYIDGKLAGSSQATGRFDAALDQFGPHSRIISPQGVESSYNYDRGGDLDELRIYDRALSNANIAELARNQTPTDIPTVIRDLAQKDWQTEWNFNHGWNRPNGIPAPLPAMETVVRKVQINDAYDLKRWWWKGTDGIDETTWPGVYNRSRLPNRLDYFQLPDWDCYALSGKSITFYMPDEKWNHIEVIGGAYGTASLLTPSNDPAAVADIDQQDTEPLLAKALFERPKGEQRTTHDFASPITGQKIRFTNVDYEWPIQEFTAYYVHPGREPVGSTTLSYSITTNASFDNPAVTPLSHFIAGRFPADERTTMIAMPGSSVGQGRTSIGHGQQANASSVHENLPIVHIIIPCDYRSLQADEGHGSSYTWGNLHAGLDGIAIDLPALNVKPTHGQYIPMNIQIKDPVWPMRNMLDFNFSVKPNESHTLWLDTRDRILPKGQSLYLTIASASPEFSSSALEGMRLRLIFKQYDQALPEHIADRLTQVRDNYANMTEESVNSRKLNLYNRFDADVTDLLRVDPNNFLGQEYWSEKNPEQPKPPFTLPPTPAGVPEWAWLQTRDLAELRSFINWYVDNRQISDGEMGGGLSDDSDFFEWWPGLAMMGSNTDKLLTSLNRGLEAIYNNGMFTNGLATAQYDELHAYEDGINVLGEAMQLDYGNPKEIERAMITAKREAGWLTGYNSAGQRQIKSSYYSGTKMAEDGVWGWAKDRSYFVYHPAILLANYNGNPEIVKMITETADGFLAHRRAGTNGKMQMHFNVNFHTNEDLPSNGLPPWFVLWAAFKFTHAPKYLAPFNDDPLTSLRTINADALDELGVRNTWGKQLLNSQPRSGDPDRRTDSGTASETTNHLKWQLTGDTTYLSKLYASQLETAHSREFVNRQGSLWIDRVYFNNGELQRARLGGVALMRNFDFPGNAVSWRFNQTASNSTPDTSVGILVPISTPNHIRIEAYNITAEPITASLIGGEIEPGKWEMTTSFPQGDAVAQVSAPTPIVDFERSKSLPVTFPPHLNVVIELTLKEKGVPYWSRPDLGISSDDVTVSNRTMKVVVHSLGAIDTQPAKLVLSDATGKVLATGNIPSLKAPIDLEPKTTVVSLKLPTPADVSSDSLTIEMQGSVPEITLNNNHISIGNLDRRQNAAERELHARR